jgi:hypothetical protein
VLSTDVKSYYASIDHLMLLGPVGAWRLRELVRTDDHDFEFVPCACPPGMEGTQGCNYGRPRKNEVEQALFVGLSLARHCQAKLFEKFTQARAASALATAGCERTPRLAPAPWDADHSAPLTSDFQSAERLTDGHCGLRPCTY